MNASWISELPRHLRTVAATTIGVVSLLTMGFVARGATVDVDDFNALVDRVTIVTDLSTENRELINAIVKQTEINTCLTITEKMDGDFRLCMITETRNRYLDRFVGGE